MLLNVGTRLLDCTRMVITHYLVGWYRRFGGTCWLHIDALQNIVPERCYPPTRLHEFEALVLRVGAVCVHFRTPDLELCVGVSRRDGQGSDA